MNITLGLVLPRDESSVPVVRHICTCALEEICASAETVSDIELALTEACSNVVEHSGPGDDYAVEVTIDDTTCVIRVVDRGKGLGGAQDPETPPLDVESENGRGMRLMRALVDHVHFESKPQEGTVVCLEKRLVFDRTTPVMTASAAVGQPAAP